jgi:pyruvate/2-oxoglutarate dehydrogenase complex dihydrolipoamide dehydrogenase (E3) component
MKVDVLKADIVVIGAGSGGLSIASGAAQLGLNVVLFEKGEMGGDCLNTGCVPSKALIAAAKTAQQMRTAARFGIQPVEPKVDWLKVRAHVNGVIETIAPIDSQERFEGLGVTVFREHARFIDKRTVGSDNVHVRAKHIVVAAGSSATVPLIPGLKDIPFLTNETVFALEEQPEHLVILGGGPIGMELGQAFRRLGSKVTILEAGKALGRADPEVAAVAVAQLRAEGIEIREDTKAVLTRGFTSGRVEVDVIGPNGKETVEGSHLLLALGRTPNLEGLNLIAGGVKTDAGGVQTTPGLRSVSNKRVWAVGDIAGRGQFTHLAGFHAGIFVKRALFRVPARADQTPIPAVTYCEPEVAQIGLTEAEARKQHGDGAITVTRWSYHENDRAQAERSVEGFGKLVIGKGGRILGLSLVGDGAGEALQIAGLAMANAMKVGALTNLISPYPTRGEIVKRLAGAYYTPSLFSARTRNLVKFLFGLPG